MVTTVLRLSGRRRNEGWRRRRKSSKSREAWTVYDPQPKGAENCNIRSARKRRLACSRLFSTVPTTARDNGGWSWHGKRTGNEGGPVNPSPAAIDRLNFPAGRSCATWDARTDRRRGGGTLFEGVAGATIYLSFIDCAVWEIFLSDSRAEERDKLNVPAK